VNWLLLLVMGTLAVGTGIGTTLPAL